MRSLLALILAVTALQTSAQETSQQQEAKRAAREKLTKDVANDVVKTLQDKMSDSKVSCFDNTCGGDASPPACRDAYASFYSKPEVNISIALGYTDDKGAIMGGGNYLHSSDSLRKQVWEQKLMRPCPEGVDGTCGFTPAPDDGDLYTKTVIGPDHQPHTVKLRLASSSVDYYDANNRKSDGQPKPPCKYLSADVAARTSAAQWRQSCRAATTFFEGLKNSDMVVYAGHARLGGGTDTAPPILIPGTLATNEAAYAARESEKRMLQILRDDPTPPKLIGVFACRAEDHFADDVKAATRNKSALVTSIGNTAPEVVFAQAYAMLDSVLAMRCEPEFKTELNEVRNAALAPTKVGRGVDTYFQPFFTENPVPTYTEENPGGGHNVNTPLVAEPLIKPDGAAGAGSPQGTDGVK